MAEGATYLRSSGDPSRRFTNYYPAWLDNLADDVTIEGSLLNGTVDGPDNVRAVVTGLRSLYEHQEFNFAGPYRENGWIEDYVAEVGGEPIACVVLVSRNAAGQTQHIAANYRPLDSLLFLSRALRERLAGSPIAEHFAVGD